MSKQKSSGLGKGLGALIRSDLTAESAEAIREEIAKDGSSLRMVLVEQIRPNPHQPRTRFEETKLEELSASIKEHGLIQPLVVVEAGKDDYTLIAGERRWRASQLAGLVEVPVVVKGETTPQEMLELAIIENVQRADLNQIEEALAYQYLIDEFGQTHEEVAQRVGKARTTVTNTVRLLKLAPEVQEAIINGDVSGGHAKVLVNLSSEEQQVAVVNQIIQHGMSVRQAEAIAKKLKEGVVPPKKQKEELSPELSDLQRRFRQKLGTKVEIEPGKNKGKIVIEYYSDEELNALFDAIVGNTDIPY